MFIIEYLVFVDAYRGGHGWSYTQGYGGCSRETGKLLTYFSSIHDLYTQGMEVSLIAKFLADSDRDD